MATQYQPRHMAPAENTHQKRAYKTVGALGLAMTAAATLIPSANASEIDTTANTYYTPSYLNYDNYGGYNTGWNNGTWNNVDGWSTWGNWYNPVVTTPEPESTGKHFGYDYVHQYQGQRYQDIDCGPSVLLMALDDAGARPSYYQSGNLRQALINMRAESIFNYTGYLMTDEIPPLLSKYGVRSTSYTGQGAQDAVERLKEGNGGIALGQTGILGPEVQPAGYGHYVYVSAYNEATGMFTVANPLNSNHEVIQVSEQKLRTFLYSNLQVNPTQNLIIIE